MPKAILSVHDKTGIVDFAQGLAGLGWTLLASGGTARLLRENHLNVTEVADYTKSPEILGGRVKTLHPAIHGGLLARSTEEDHQQLTSLGWDYIDLVAVNLYPFEATIARKDATDDEIIENIDIGGVTLIRAAAKNHGRVTLVCDPADYGPVLEELEKGEISADTRRILAHKGFTVTARYDNLIAGYLSDNETVDLHLYQVQVLRYGENPHQSAALFSYTAGEGPLGGKLLQGKELSYNNLLDLDAAWRAAVSFDEPSICIVKHLSPCGIAIAEKQLDAYKAAYACDPISAFGGVIAANRPFEAETAYSFGEHFVECIAAPGFNSEAKKILSARKNLRLVEMPGTEIKPDIEFRSVNHGLLRQDIDLGDPGSGSSWKVVSKRKPTDAELKSLHFAMKACQHVKSNAIVFVQGTATVGIGGGQPNRVDCVRIAAARAGDKSKGAVMASDAFFPFPDSIEVAAQAGITAIVQPGGSTRDEEAIQTANGHNIAMVVTGVRHFRH